MPTSKKDTRKRRFGFLRDIASNVGDFGQAVVDKAGGGIVRSAVRLGALASEPLPGEQRKTAERFIQENLEANKRKSGVGAYNEDSVGGRIGRKTGETIKVGAELAGGGAASKAGMRVGAKLAKGNKSSRALTFLGGIGAGATASDLAEVGRGNEPRLSVARIPIQLAQSAAEPFGGPAEIKTQGTPLRFTGADPIKSYQRQGRDIADQAEERGIVKDGLGKKAISFLAAPVLAGADVAGSSKVKPKVNDALGIVEEVDATSSIGRPAAQTQDIASTGSIKPVSPGPGERQRGLLRTTEGAKSLPLSSRQAIREIEPQTYKQINVEQTLTRAREKVATNFDEAKRVVDQSFETKVWNDETSSLTRALVEKAAKEGNDTLVKELMDKAAALGTSTGQANSLWRGMADSYDPEGMVRFAQKVVDDANKNAGILTKAVRNLRGKGEYTLDDATKQAIREDMAKALKLPDGPEKDQIMKGIFERIGDRVPPGASEAFDAYRYQNLLSNPRTHLRNLTGNLFQTMITRPATLATRATVDWFGATLFGKDREFYLKEVPDYYRGMFNSFADASEAAKLAWKGDTPMGNPDLKDLQSLRNQKLPKYLTVVPRLMEAQDRFLMTLISAGEYAAQKAKGVADDIARKEAEKIAEYSLFRSMTDPHNATGQGVLLSKIDQLTDIVTRFGAEHKAFRWFVPFIRTPANISKQFIEYSPLGALALKGSNRKLEQASKAMAGTMLTVIGAKLALDGNTTWDAPKDETERKLFYESGKRPYSIRVGDKWVPMIYFGPFALAFALPAAAKDANDDAPLDASTMERVAAAAQNSAKFFSQQTYVQGIANVVDLISGEGDANLANSLGFTAGQAIPLQGLQRYIAGVIDPTFRKADGFFESIQKDTPLLSKGLEAHTNLSGEESRRNTTDYVAPYTLGVPEGAEDDRATREANSEFLRTLRRTSRMRTRANEQINEALADQDYARAQQIAESYNRKLRDIFKPVVKKHRSNLSGFLAEEYGQQKIKLTRASISRRRQNMVARSNEERNLVNR